MLLDAGAGFGVAAGVAAFAWTQGAIFFRDAMWRIMMPILAIALFFQLSVITMARSLELAFSPRLRAMV